MTRATTVAANALLVLVVAVLSAAPGPGGRLALRDAGPGLGPSTRHRRPGGPPLPWLALTGTGAACALALHPRQATHW